MIAKKFNLKLLKVFLIVHLNAFIGFSAEFIAAPAPVKYSQHSIFYLIHFNGLPFLISNCPY